MVLSHVLLGHRHSPSLFHKVCPHVVEVLHVLRDDVDAVVKFITLIHSLMLIHAGFPEVKQFEIFDSFVLLFQKTKLFSD